MLGQESMQTSMLQGRDGEKATAKTSKAQRQRDSIHCKQKQQYVRVIDEDAD